MSNKRKENSNFTIVTVSLCSLLMSARIYILQNRVSNKVIAKFTFFNALDIDLFPQLSHTTSFITGQKN